MKVWPRSMTVLVIGLALVGLSGCSAGSTVEPKNPSTEKNGQTESHGLEQVNLCEVLRSKEVKELGLEGPGTPGEVLPWKPSCDYNRGSTFTLSIYKNKRQTVDSAESELAWASFQRVKVNDRAGAEAISQGSTEARICNVLFNAGKGLINVQLSDSFKKVDECAKALEIAEMIEPRMPEPA